MRLLIACIYSFGSELDAPVFVITGGGASVTGGGAFVTGVVIGAGGWALASMVLDETGVWALAVLRFELAGEQPFFAKTKSLAKVKRQVYKRWKFSWLEGLIRINQVQYQFWNHSLRISRKKPLLIEV
jgi:hypothetical protein